MTRVATAREIMDAAIDEHSPSHVFGMFSGGHDSLCACHVASLHPRFDGCVHINTGIGIEQTREFVRATCQDHGWPLKEYHPPVSYREIVLKHGFPGPASHWVMYARLKERCIRQLIREHKTRHRDRILLVTGVRRAESTRRMGYVQPVNRIGAQVWVAPIIDWSNDDKTAHIAEHKLPENPVVKLLCMSGECLCGAFARPGEIKELELWFPEVAERIHALEREANAARVPAVWGTAPAVNWESLGQPDLPLCWSCEAKREQG